MLGMGEKGLFKFFLIYQKSDLFDVDGESKTYTVIDFCKKGRE